MQHFFVRIKRNICPCQSFILKKGTESLHFLLMWWLRSRLSLCWTFPTADYFPSSETPLSIILFPLFLFRTGQAVVLLRHIYWPLLASTCSPLKALVCWPDGYMLSLSCQCCEMNSIFGISTIIYCAIGNNRWIQSFEHWNKQDLIQRGYLSNLFFSVVQKCGEHLCVSVWMWSAVCRV